MNNVAAGGATNATFQFLSRPAGNATPTVRAIAQDPAPLARDDSTRLLSGTDIWSGTVSLNELHLTSRLDLSGGPFRFTVAGAAPQGFAVQGSTNLSTRVRLDTKTLTAGNPDYANSGFAGIPHGYYRTLSPP